MLAIFASSYASVAFQSSISTCSTKLQATNSDRSDQSKKKNPFTDAVLFGKPQYNWVTGKTEEKMASTYIHNWNTFSKKRRETEDAVTDGKKKQMAGGERESQQENKSWWKFL